jgi:dTDP-4-amino-4,6-dideoxygalactose transaminase
VRLELVRLAIDRAAAIAALHERGIGASVHFIPLHLHPYYRRQWGTRPEDHPVATEEYGRVISLPIWPGMSDDDVQRVVDALTSIVDGARLR